MKKILSVVLALALMLSLCACDSMDYKKAQTAFEEGNYQEAHAMFVELGDYEDSADMVLACDYEIACDLLESGKYDDAFTAFTALGDYADSAKKADQSLLAAVDAALQGTWDDPVMADYGIVSTFTFQDGRIKPETRMGTASLPSNEGDYRIDMEKGKIYAHYDYLISMDSNGTTTKKPNTSNDEVEICSFTYKNGKLSLTDAMGTEMTKQ